MDLNPSDQKLQFSLFSPTNIIAIYITLSILLKMKETLGLGAMLEYLGRCSALLGKDNPRMQWAVAKALSLMDVEKMYREAHPKDEE